MRKRGRGLESGGRKRPVRRRTFVRFHCPCGHNRNFPVHASLRQDALLGVFCYARYITRHLFLLLDAGVLNPTSGTWPTTAEAGG